MFSPLQMQSLPSPLLPPFAVQPVEPPSLLQLCLPRRGSEFMLPSRFHPRFGDLPNANANALLPPRLETCRRYPNLRSSFVVLRSELQLRPAGPQMNRVTLIDASCPQRCRRGPHATPRSSNGPIWQSPSSPIGPQGRFIIRILIVTAILGPYTSYTCSLISSSICHILLHRLLQSSLSLQRFSLTCVVYITPIPRRSPSESF